MEKTSNKLVDLSVAFAVEILNLVKYLKSQHETIICNQIGRAETSIEANIHEAQYTHGKADFISKLQLSNYDSCIFLNRQINRPSVPCCLLKVAVMFKSTIYVMILW